MNISSDKLRTFARETVAEYNEKTTLRSISNLQTFDNERHEYRDFSQLGKRINIPKRFFAKNRTTVTTNISSSFADSLTTAEEKFILSSIEEEVDDGQLESYTVKNFTFESIIIESFQHTFDADHIYIPNNKDYRLKLQEWNDGGRMKYDDGNQYVLGASEIKVNWMPSSWGFNDVFIFNSSDINVIQKQYKDLEYPDYIDPVQEFDGAEDNDNLMMYLGEHPKDPEDFELFYRIVLSEPRFTGASPNGAAIARLQNDGES